LSLDFSKEGSDEELNISLLILSSLKFDSSSNLTISVELSKIFVAAQVRHIKHIELKLLKCGYTKFKLLG
jgi:hypothetical protein